MPVSDLSVRSTRRSFLGLMGAAATVPLLSGTATAAPSSSRSADPRPGAAVDFVSVSWTGEQAPRISPIDGPRAGEWIDVSSTCTGGLDGRSLHRHSALVPVHGASLYVVDASSTGEVWTRPVTAAAAMSSSFGATRARLAGRTYLARPNWGADESL